MASKIVMLILVVIAIVCLQVSCLKLQKKNSKERYLDDFFFSDQQNGSHKTSSKTRVKERKMLDDDSEDSPDYLNDEISGVDEGSAGGSGDSPTDGSGDLPSTNGSGDLPSTNGSGDLPTDGSGDLPTDGSGDLPSTDGSEELPTTDGSGDLPTTDGSGDYPITDGSEVFHTTEEPSILKLVFVRVCNLDFSCSNGSRAVCEANEILVEDESPSAKDNIKNMDCSLLSNFPWNGCKLILSNASSTSGLLPGRCVLKSNEDPCIGFPDNYHYDPVNKKCRQIFNETNEWIREDYCGEDQINEGKTTSSCRCINKKHLILSQDQRCYQPYTRGPCDLGYWLEPSNRREANCRRSPCPHDLIDGNHFYWDGNFHGPAGCYQTNTQGPCPNGKVFVIADYSSGTTRCEKSS